MARSNLNAECRDLELIIDGLAAGIETYHEEETQYSLADALDYLRGFLRELKDLNDQRMAPVLQDQNTLLCLSILLPGDLSCLETKIRQQALA